MTHDLKAIIRKSKEEVAAWPKWMKEAAHIAVPTVKYPNQKEKRMTKKNTKTVKKAATPKMDKVTFYVIQSSHGWEDVVTDSYELDMYDSSEYKITAFEMELPKHVSVKTTTPTPIKLKV